MRLVWKSSTLTDLIEIRDYITEDNPAAALRVAKHIRKSARQLLQNPYIGRVGTVNETRELVVTKFPYILVYELKENTIGILRIIHTSRLWPGTRE